MEEAKKSNCNEIRHFIFDLADVYGLVEGHLTSNKTANTVLSMLHNTIPRPISNEVENIHGKKLVLNADNCTGQNKNKFVLFYIMWRTLMGFEHEFCFSF